MTNTMDNGATGATGAAASAGAALAARAERVIPGGVNSSTRRLGAPYGFARSAGAYLWDLEGRRYTDFHAAFGAIVLGHNDEGVDRAVAEEARILDLTGIGVSEREVELAELVVEVMPAVEKMVACTSGSEATFHATRISRAVTGRDIIVKVQGGYHGWHDAVARNCISAPERAYGMDPMSTGVLAENLEKTVIAEYNDLGSLEKLYAEHPGRIAAVFLEPIPHNVGALLPDPGYLEGVRELTRREGSVLLFDEVITGFRHDVGGWQAISGVTPDLTSFGKAMANGYPVAGLGGRADLMDQFNSAAGGVLLAGTFTGHPAMCAGAIETITRLRDTDVIPRAARLGDRMRAGLRAISDELGLQTVVTGYGSVFCMYFLDGEVHGYRDLMRNDDAMYRDFHRGMIDRGFVMLPMSLKRNHISGAHTEADIDAALEAARETLTELAARR
ncbi:aspartate aminotransferase family protein [Brachybacterium huguangmaarense]